MDFINCVFCEDYCVDTSYFEALDDAAHEAGLKHFVVSSNTDGSGHRRFEPPPSHPHGTPAKCAQSVKEKGCDEFHYGYGLSLCVSAFGFRVRDNGRYSAGSWLRYDCSNPSVQIWGGDFERELDYWLRIEHTMRYLHARFPVSLWIGGDKPPIDMILFPGEVAPPIPCAWCLDPELRQDKLHDPEEFAASGFGFLREYPEGFPVEQRLPVPSKWRPFFDRRLRHAQEGYEEWLAKKPDDFPLQFRDSLSILWSGGRCNEGVATLLWHDLHRGAILHSIDLEDRFYVPPDTARHELRKRLWHMQTEDDVLAAFGAPAFCLGAYGNYGWEEREYDGLSDCLDMLVYGDLVPNCLTIIRVWEDGMVTALFSGFPKN